MPGRLAQILCPRDLSGQVVGQGKYVALCDHQGTLINDPIVMKVADDCYWLSIANSDIWTWARCVAGERGLDVTVSEPDVSPLAVQGPKAEDVVASLLGDWVRELRYFWFRDAELEGIPLKVMRAGWSKQGGFELFLLDGTKGDRLWQLVREAGEPFGIGPGSPNMAERVESGLISYDVDSDERTNPFELRMARFMDLDVPDDVIGIAALRRIAAEGAKRHQLGIILDGDRRDEHAKWHEVSRDGAVIGHMTNGTWSYRLERMIGYALVSTSAAPGDAVEVDVGGARYTGRLATLPLRT